MKKKLYKHYTGIDSGRSTGVAMFDGLNLVLKNSDFWGVIALMRTTVIGSMVFVIEDPSGVKPFFPQGKDLKPKDIMKMISYVGKINQDIGRNKEQANLLIQFARLQGHTVETVFPDKNFSKWDAHQLKIRTGYTGRTNEHTRDAVRVLWQFFNHNRHLTHEHERIKADKI